tara:strand:- start:900 stop:1265 length:366 start_codon:yes stop_codon:yes gene_type:complete
MDKVKDVSALLQLAVESELKLVDIFNAVVSSAGQKMVGETRYNGLVNKLDKKDLELALLAVTELFEQMTGLQEDGLWAWNNHSWDSFYYDPKSPTSKEKFESDRQRLFELQKVLEKSLTDS